MHYLGRGITLLLLASCLYACGGSNKNEPSTFSKIKETGKAVKNLSKSQKQMENVVKDAETLSQMTPMEQEDLKAWLPQQLGNYKRTLYKTGDLVSTGTTAMESEFKQEGGSGQLIHFQLVDGAGSFAATLIAGFNQGFLMQMEEEREHYYKKQVTRNGLTALEEYDSEANSSELQFVYNQRYLITLSGDASPDVLWDFVKALPLSQLK